jgi:hypothetical protein
MTRGMVETSAVLHDHCGQEPRRTALLIAGRAHDPGDSHNERVVTRRTGYVVWGRRVREYPVAAEPPRTGVYLARTPLSRKRAEAPGGRRAATFRP